MRRLTTLVLASVFACSGNSDTEVAPVERAARLAHRYDSTAQILTALEPDLSAEEPAVRGHALGTLREP